MDWTEEQFLSLQKLINKNNKKIKLHKVNDIARWFEFNQRYESNRIKLRIKLIKNHGLSLDDYSKLTKRFQPDIVVSPIDIQNNDPKKVLIYALNTKFLQSGIYSVSRVA